MAPRRSAARLTTHAWRSLLPITHSISLDVYEPETGLFMWNSDPAVEALEIMKRMMPLANPDVLQPGKTDGGVNQTPDEQVFASKAAAYYIKYQNAHLRFASTWEDPSQVTASPHCQRPKMALAGRCSGQPARC